MSDGIRNDFWLSVTMMMTRPTYYLPSYYEHSIENQIIDLTKRFDGQRKRVSVCKRERKRKREREREREKDSICECLRGLPAFSEDKKIIDFGCGKTHIKFTSHINHFFFPRKLNKPKSLTTKVFLQLPRVPLHVTPFRSLQ